MENQPVQLSHASCVYAAAKKWRGAVAGVRYSRWASSGFVAFATAAHAALIMEARLGLARPAVTAQQRSPITTSPLFAKNEQYVHLTFELLAQLACSHLY